MLTADGASELLPESLNNMALLLLLPTAVQELCLCFCDSKLIARAGASCKALHALVDTVVRMRAATLRLRLNFPSKRSVTCQLWLLEVNLLKVPSLIERVREWIGVRAEYLARPQYLKLLQDLSLVHPAIVQRHVKDLVLPLLLAHRLPGIHDKWLHTMRKTLIQAFDMLRKCESCVLKQHIEAVLPFATHEQPDLSLVPLRALQVFRVLDDESLTHYVPELLPCLEIVSDKWGTTSRSIRQLMFILLSRVPAAAREHEAAIRPHLEGFEPGDVEFGAAQGLKRLLDADPGALMRDAHARRDRC